MGFYVSLEIAARERQDSGPAAAPSSIGVLSELPWYAKTA
jgi:hypothetical protein